MKIALPTLALLSALLSACGNTTPPTVATVTVTGSSQVEIGKPTVLTVEARDTNGQPMSVQPTFTSSRPDIVTVSSTGELQARRLTVTGSPVTITALAAGKSSTLNVVTYGLDVRGGTYRYADGVTPVFYAGFRDVNGKGVTADTQYTITPPANFKFPASSTGKALTGTLFKAGSAGTVFPGDEYVATTGEYRASVTVDGRTYSKTFAVDASKMVDLPSGITATLTQSSMTFQGSLAGSNVQSLYGVVYNRTESLAFTEVLSTLPATVSLTAPLGSGEVAYGAYVRDFIGDKLADSPDQLNMGFVYLGRKTF